MIIDRSEKIRKQTLRRQKNIQRMDRSPSSGGREGACSQKKQRSHKWCSGKKKRSGPYERACGGEEDSASKDSKVMWDSEVAFFYLTRWVLLGPSVWPTVHRRVWVASKDSGSKRDQEKVKDAARVINTADSADTKVSACFNDWWEVQQASNTASRR